MHCKYGGYKSSHAPSFIPIFNLVPRFMPSFLGPVNEANAYLALKTNFATPCADLS